MLWTIFVILVVLWLLGLVTSYTLGGFIHILTASFIFDLSAVTRYVPPVSPTYHQEAPYVSSVSDWRRRLCYSSV
jgi:uncharacterized protein DUF5670